MASCFKTKSETGGRLFGLPAACHGSSFEVIMVYSGIGLVVYIREY